MKDAFDRSAIINSVDAKLYELLKSGLERHFSEHGGLAINAPKGGGKIVDANGNAISFGDWVLNEYEPDDESDTIHGTVTGSIGECFAVADGLGFQLETASHGRTHLRYIASLDDVGWYINHRLDDLDDAALQDFDLAWPMALLKAGVT
jgi:hypothetical protein